MFRSPYVVALFVTLVLSSTGLAAPSDMPMPADFRAVTGDIIVLCAPGRWSMGSSTRSQSAECKDAIRRWNMLVETSPSARDFWTKGGYVLGKPIQRLDYGVDIFLIRGSMPIEDFKQLLAEHASIRKFMTDRAELEAEPAKKTPKK